MAVIIIDQKPYEVDPEKNVLESAISLGIDVPYFCWHPALGSVGSCRLCAVQQMTDENDTQGRTVMACMTPVKDQARFSIVHPTATEFRAAVTEWLMTNHPHDCPVCDEGGECHLQDMTLLSGHNYRRYRFAKRTFRNQNLGPLINHEMNRCITCYRCVRYYQDVAGGTDLSAFKSSANVYFGRFSDGPLESEFSGNLVEVCPTGVFTDKTYHQRYVRKWDLSTAPSVCQLCSVGCNISPGQRNGILRRVQNRYHHDVNGFFICDRGRFGHEFINSDRRLTKPTIKKNSIHEEVSFESAAHYVRQLIDNSNSTIGIGSPNASLESNWLLQKLVGKEHFYDGLLASTSRSMHRAYSAFSAGVVEHASMKDVREADAVLVIGEDVTNTAPMIALSIRQAAMAFKKNCSRQELNIDTWNDNAIKDFARGNMLPLFAINATSSALDDISHGCYLEHPWKIAQSVSALLRALNDDHNTAELSQELNAWITRVKSALLQAKKPVIVVGTSLGEPLLIDLGVALTKKLDEISGGAARLSVVLPDANSLGLSLLSPRPMYDWYDSSTKSVDLAIVLEQDLHWRLGNKAFQTFCQNVQHLVVIDSINHETAKAAKVILPSQTFLESTGTMISSEGRLQRYFSAAAKDDAIKNSAHILQALMDKATQTFSSVDDIAKSMAKELGIGIDNIAKLYDEDFRINGQKIAREFGGASGRTAINAHISVHEQKIPQDPDSPFGFSMEGARKKIPLPLISASWAPRINSVQASFKSILSTNAKQPDAFGGVRLFPKYKSSALHPSISFSQRQQLQLPYVYVLPKFNVFSSFVHAKYASSLSTRFPQVEAEISAVDANALGFSSFASIVLETSHGKFSMLAKTKDLPPGVLLLPYGLVDSSLFYSACLCRVVTKENV